MAERSVSERYFPFTITTPAGTSDSAPQSTPLTVPDTILRNVEVRIPSGHVGLTGIALLASGTQILPWGTLGNWIIGDEDYLQFPINIEVSGRLEVVTYNVGVYSHNHYLRIRLDDLPLRSARQLVVPNSAITPDLVTT